LIERLFVALMDVDITAPLRPERAFHVELNRRANFPNHHGGGGFVVVEFDQKLKVFPIDRVLLGGSKQVKQVAVRILMYA
jgi:hypothetical protein